MHSSINLAGGRCGQLISYFPNSPLSRTGLTNLYPGRLWIYVVGRKSAYCIVYWCWFFCSICWQSAICRVLLRLVTSSSLHCSWGSSMSVFQYELQVMFFHTLPIH